MDTQYLRLLPEQWLSPDFVPEFGSWRELGLPFHGVFYGTDPNGPRGDVNTTTVVSIGPRQRDGKLVLRHYDDAETTIWPDQKMWFTNLRKES